MSDENLYLKATQEVENEEIDPALWAKALTQACGEQHKAKYKYIELRVNQLKLEQAEEKTNFTKITVDEFSQKYMPVSEFSAIKSITEDKLIKMIRDGFYIGQVKEGKWYISREESGESASSKLIHPPNVFSRTRNQEYVPVSEFSEFSAIPTEVIIRRIRDGNYCGKIIEGKWFVAYSEVEKLHSVTRNSSYDDLPEGVVGWSWGAFLLNGIWAIGNRVWWGLLAFVPYVGFLVAIWLGFKGKELAWKARSWKSVNEFKKAQKLWSVWAIMLYVVTVSILAIVAISEYTLYIERVRLLQ